MRIKLNRKRNRALGSLVAYLLVLAVFIIAFATSCTSRSGEMIENRITERCVVIDAYSLRGVDIPIRHYLKVIRVSDNTIHGKLTHQPTLYEVGDTLLLPFDKRYDY